MEEGHPAAASAAAEPSPTFLETCEFLTRTYDHDEPRPDYLIQYRSILDVPRWWELYRMPLTAPCPLDVHPRDWQSVLELVAGLQLYARLNPGQVSERIVISPAKPKDILLALRIMSTTCTRSYYDHPRCERSYIYRRKTGLPRPEADERPGSGRIQTDVPRWQPDARMHISSVWAYARDEWEWEWADDEPEGIEVCCCEGAQSYCFDHGMEHPEEVMGVIDTVTPRYPEYALANPPEGAETVEGPCPETLLREVYSGQRSRLGCRFHLMEEGEVDDPDVYRELAEERARLEEERELHCIRTHNRYECLRASCALADPSLPQRPIRFRFLHRRPARVGPQRGNNRIASGRAYSIVPSSDEETEMTMKEFAGDCPELVLTQLNELWDDAWDTFM